MHISTLLGAVLAAGSILWQGNAQVTTECDPTKVTCPNDQGLATDSYSIDFTTIKTLPAEWQLADYTNVGLGDQGAEFTFAKRYDAPTMWTKFKFFFGRVEFVGKAAPGVGIVSSMVLLSDDLDEIDWEFLGGVTTNVQTNYFGKGYTGSYNRSTSPAVQSPQTQFHTYALDWSTAALTWSIDGVVVRTLNAADADGNGDQYPQSPMKVSLGLWDAGDPDAATQGWGGGVTPIPPPEPYTMYVKSVKIFNQNPAQQYQYTDKSGSWKSIKVINDVAFSSSSSIPATQASTLSLGSTSASSSSQASQSSEVTSSLISNSAASTAASTEPSTQLISSSSSGSSQPTVAAGSVTLENATSGYQASADSHPVITVLSTSTATLTSCSSKSDCPTYSNPGNSVTTPVASSSNIQPVSSSASGSGSTWTTPVTSAVAQITSTSASTLPSSSNGSSSSTATSASSSASVALSTGSSSSAVVTSASLSTSVNNNSTMTTQSPYPPSSAITETDGFIQLPSVNTSCANSQYASSTATIASVSPSASSSGIASASTKPSTSGSTSSIQIVPTASTAAVTILSTESCTEESSNLGLTPPLTISSSSKTTSPSFLSFSFSSAILSSTTATSNQSGTSSSPVETSTAIPTLASSWASKAVPSGPSALFSTLVTSPSTILIPVTPILSPPSSQAPPTNIPSPSPSSPSLSQPAATSNTNSSIAVSSMTASGFSTSSAAADDTTSTVIDTATTTVACTRLPSTPAPGSDSDDEDDADDVPTSMPSTGPSATVVSQKTSSASAAAGVDNTPPVPSSASNDAPPNPNPNPESESETDTDADADADTDDTTAPVAQDKAMAEDSSAPPASSSSDDDMEDDMDDGQEADGNPSNSPTTPTVANKTPSMSSIALAVDNGTAILKPSIASTMPGGLAIPSGTWALKNGTVPFTGSGNAVVPVSGMGLLGMVGAVMVGVF